ncbi:MAG TPA: PAS domain S-box protein [Thermomicrobiales bacterium]|nr:PAS domain S-box protein [Thermomicrobiales bacterium]
MAEGTPFSMWSPFQTPMHDVPDPDHDMDPARVRSQLALKAARLFTWEIDTATGRIWYSPNAADILGYTPGETITQGVSHVHPADRDNLRRSFERAARGEAALNADYRIVNPHSGAMFWARTQGQLLSEGEGQPGLLVGVTQDVTDRKRTEEDLRESQAQFQTLFDTIDEGFCIIEVIFDDAGAPVDYRFETVNPAFERHTGLHNATGKRMREFVPDHESYWFDIYGRVAMTGEPARFTAGAKALNDRWFNLYASRIGDDDSRRVAVLFTDITDRRRTEEALRRSEERLRRAIEIETVGIVFFRPDGTITDANDAFLRLSGYDRADLANGQWKMDAITPPEWISRSHQATDEMIRLGRNTPYEREYLRKDGSRWWGLFAATRIDDQEAVKYIIDITRAKRAEIDRARLATLVASSHDSIVGTNVDGIITDWNRGAEELYGYAPRETVGKHIGMLTPDDRKDELRSFYTRLLAGEQIPPTETVRVHKDGRRLDVELMLSPIVDAVGRTVGVAGIARNATARKQQERAQQDFLAMASHDLKTPVTVMRARAQLMRRRKAYDERGVDVILDQTRRMERLVSDLQIAAQLESGQLELQRSYSDANDLVREAAERTRAQTEQHHVHVDPSPRPVTGWWDPDRIGQVLDNLLGNAIKYSPNGGTIVVSVSAGDGMARLSVADEGAGIPEDIQGRLFERFYRADEAGLASGLGLGLYITQLLVAAHGGRIELRSAPGAGSTFTVVLPLADEDETASMSAHQNGRAT